MATTAGHRQDAPSDPTAPPAAGPPANGHAYGDPTLLASGEMVCSNCGAQMAPDQRYCVECGERRGPPRFTFATPAGEMADAPGRKRSHWAAWSNGATLIVGVATLLLALGVGVLIGHAGNGNQKPPSVTVNAAGGAASGSGTSGTAGSSAAGNSSTPASGTATSGGGSAGSGASGSHTAGSGAASHPRAAAHAVANPNQAANQGASKALGHSGNLGSATQQPGASCQAGSPGCVHGKQTSQLFGGG
jgi:hypothetical protein